MGPLLTVALTVILTAEADALPDGRPTIPRSLDRGFVGLQEPELRGVLGGSSECFLLGLRSGSWCVVPPTNAADKTERPTLLFKSLVATRAALKRKWGTPAIYGTSWYWVNPSAKPPLRARLHDTDDPAQLDFAEYLPLQVLLGTGPALAFEKTPILGATQAALRTTYAAKCENAESCDLFFLPCEVGSDVLVMIEFSNGVATKIVFDVPATDQVVALLEQKWGKRSLTEGEKHEWRFATRKDVLLYQLGRDLTVRISR